MNDIKFRPHQRKDIPYRMKWWRNQKATKFLNDIRKNNVKQENQWFDRYFKDKSKQFFTILYKNIPIGMAGLTDISEINKNASVFIIIGDDRLHNKGIGRQAVKFIVDYGFKKLKLHKIKITVCAKHIAAIRAYKAAGFKKEAEVKDEFYIDGKLENEILMAIFKNKSL